MVFTKIRVILLRSADEYLVHFWISLFPSNLSSFTCVSADKFFKQTIFRELPACELLKNLSVTVGVSTIVRFLIDYLSPLSRSSSNPSYLWSGLNCISLSCKRYVLKSSLVTSVCVPEVFPGWNSSGEKLRIVTSELHYLLVLVIPHSNFHDFAI